MSRYRLLPVGIFDTLLNREIQPGEDAWREYQIALLGGDSPDPMQASAPDLEAVRAERLAEVNLRRQAALAGGVRFGDHVYDSDPASRANITGVVTAIAVGLTLPPDFVWRSADNLDVPMDAPTITALGATMLGHANACYAWSWQLKALLNAAADPRAVDIDNGWPQ